jgi:ABC-2 type transport system permease protein
MNDEVTAPDVFNETRPLYWSVRREVWENRSIYLVPIAVAAFILFVMLATTFTLPKKMRAATAPAQIEKVVNSYMMTPAPIMFTTFLVGMFFALDALYGERRDRSILFWKSLPVSDRTVVLSKLIVVMAVLPAIAIVLSLIVRAVLVIFGTMVLTASGVSAAPLWTRVYVEPIVMIYGMTIHELWFAPVYAWLLLVSAWARRAPFLWAVLPFAVPAAIEHALSEKRYFSNMLRHRFDGAMSEGFTIADPQQAGVIDQLAQLAPLKFLSAPGLWAGLIFAAACLVAAVRLRRRREPI